MKKIIKYVFLDLIRNKIVIIYTLFLLVLSLSIFNLEDNMSKGLLSLLNIILIIVPMVSILFSCIYIYNSAEFLELMVSQPLKRKTIWLSIFFGLAASLSISFIIGIGLPVMIYGESPGGNMIILAGLLLTNIFIAIAMLAAVKTRDKARGIGLAILLWLYFSILFDGIILFILFQFEDYPLEKPMIAASFLNPIDIGRILVLLKMDVSALMGYTGAVFKNFFGTQTGIIITFILMLLWIFIPVSLSARKFSRKDL